MIHDRPLVQMVFAPVSPKKIIFGDVPAHFQQKGIVILTKGG